MKCAAYPLWKHSVNNYQQFQLKVMKATAGLKRTKMKNKDKDTSQFHNQIIGGLT